MADSFSAAVVEAPGVRSGKTGLSPSRAHHRSPGVFAVSLPSGCAQRVKNSANMEQRCAGLRTSAVTAAFSASTLG